MMDLLLHDGMIMDKNRSNIGIIVCMMMVLLLQYNNGEKYEEIWENDVRNRVDGLLLHLGIWMDNDLLKYGIDMVLELVSMVLSWQNETQIMK